MRVTVFLCRNGEYKETVEVNCSLMGMSSTFKTLYVKKQTQEMYFRNQDDSAWIMPEFNMYVYKNGGMHPRDVRFVAVEEKVVPAELRMRKLMGAL